MTREEVINQLQDAKDGYREYLTNEAFDIAIEALEQEPILDKIRTEIKALTSNRGFLSCSVDYIHEEIDAVFDKYRVEKEQEDE